MKPTLALMFLVAGCGRPAVAALTSCEVAEGSGAHHLRATKYGAVFAFERDGAMAQRYAGAGCDLRPDGSKPIAITELLGADDLGNVYAFPREARDPFMASTMLPGGRPEGYVARVDPSGHVTNLLEAGRGIWSFGVAPGGDALWFIGCAPGGAYTIRDGVLDRAPSIAWPESGASDHSVLTDGHTLWTVGDRASLVRTTAEGSQAVGSLDQSTQLFPCGPRVCGLLPATNDVLIWDADGTLIRTLQPSDFGATGGDAVVELSGNAHGVYLLLRGLRGDTRVVFAPAP